MTTDRIQIGRHDIQLIRTIELRAPCLKLVNTGECRINFRACGNHSHSADSHQLARFTLFKMGTIGGRQHPIRRGFITKKFEHRLKRPHPGRVALHLEDFLVNIVRAGAATLISSTDRNIGFRWVMVGNQPQEFPVIIKPIAHKCRNFTQRFLCLIGRHALRRINIIVLHQKIANGGDILTQRTIGFVILAEKIHIQRINQMRAFEMLADNRVERRIFLHRKINIR